MKPANIRASVPESKAKGRTVTGISGHSNRTVPKDRKCMTLTQLYGFSAQDKEEFPFVREAETETFVSVPSPQLPETTPPPLPETPPSLGAAEKTEKVDLSRGCRTPSRRTGPAKDKEETKPPEEKPVVKAREDVVVPMILDEDSDEEEVDVHKTDDPMMKTASGSVFLTASTRKLSVQASKRPSTDSVFHQAHAPKYLDFQVPISTARHHMIQWRDAQLMIPLDVTTRFSHAVFTAVFCPFILYSGIALTRSGVREFKNSPPFLPSFEEEKGGITRELISHLSPWNFKKAQTKEIAEAQAKELANCAGGFSKVKFLKRMSEKDVWEKEMKPHLVQVLSETDGVPACGTIVFDDIDWRVIYVPIYLSSFNYEGKTYMFALNGQNGECYGEKPFGVSGLLRGLPKFLTGACVEGSAKIGITTGEELCKKDKCDLYTKDHLYFVLPGTDTFLFFTSTGKCTLKNTAPEPLSDDPFENAVIVRAQGRLNRRVGNTAVIRPGETLSFTFVYTWVLEVLSGDARCIDCVNIETSGGDNTQDRMGMVCGHPTDISEKAISARYSLAFEK